MLLRNRDARRTLGSLWRRGGSDCDRHYYRVNWEDAIEIVVAKTKHERFRELCSNDNPNIVQRDNYRKSVIAMATGENQPQSEYPSVGQQIANAFGAAGRVAGAIMSGNQVLVSDEEFARRMSICESCPHWTAEKRCKLCGCRQEKLRLATESCPDNPPRWLSIG